MQNNKLIKTGIHQSELRTSYFRFYEELNDFLPEHFFKEIYPFSFSGTPSVKNLIETIGVPHTEVDLVFQLKN